VYICLSIRLSILLSQRQTTYCFRTVSVIILPPNRK
jgi:hypothetical protein